MSDFTLSWIDLTIIIVYIFGIIWYGISKGKQQSSEEYFLAGRDMTWPIVGISLFAANIGSNTLIGLTADAFNTNVGVYNYEWMAAVVLVFFAIFFLPFYLRSKVYTMPEFLERRYDVRSRYYFSFITIVGNVIIDTASGLYAGNLILRILFPDIPSAVIITILAFAAAAYTIPGGLSSVVHTEVIQAVLLLAGAIILTFFAFTEVGGWSGLIEGLQARFDSGQLSKTPDEVFSLVNPITDSHMPWTGLLFGVPLLGFYFWATNQFMVQRALSAKNLDHGRWGALFAGLLKLPVLFFMVFPGVVAIVLYSELDISALNYATDDGSICTRLADCPNMSYPVLIYNLLPTGILGLIIAGLLAAMSSSISATLNSASTLVTMDFVSKISPNMSSKSLVRAGQIATTVLVLLAAAWAPQIEKFRSLWEYLQVVLSMIAPPVVAVFLVGLFWKRANGTGAIASLLFGLLLSAYLIISQYVLTDVETYWDTMHFLHKAPLLMLACMVVNIAASLMTAEPDEEKVAAYTWTPELYRQESEELKGRPWYENYRILGAVLLIITAIIVIWYA